MGPDFDFFLIYFYDDHPFGSSFVARDEYTRYIGSWIPFNVIIAPISILSSLLIIMVGQNLPLLFLNNLLFPNMQVLLTEDSVPMWTGMFDANQVKGKKFILYDKFRNKFSYQPNFYVLALII